MGWFRNLFTPNDELVERRLIEMYIKIFSEAGQIPPGQSAVTLVQSLYQRANENLQSGKITRTGISNAGSKTLSQNSEGTKALLVKLSSEGVTREDFLSWWDLLDLERAMISAVNDWYRFMSLEQYRDEGLDRKEAAQKVRKNYPIYGTPKDTKHTQGDDRPLPIELQDRVNKWVTLMANENKEQFENMKNETSTMNALIRKEFMCSDQ